jgi:hypothetical protein
VTVGDDLEQDSEQSSRCGSNEGNVRESLQQLATNSFDNFGLFNVGGDVEQEAEQSSDVSGAPVGGDLEQEIDQSSACEGNEDAVRSSCNNEGTNTSPARSWRARSTRTSSSRLGAGTTRAT